jgi:hypothetical protein
MNHHAPDTPFPCAWVTIHCLSKEVDEKHHDNVAAQSKFVQLVYHLMDLFMCQPCQSHMGEYLRSNPLPLPRRETENNRRYFRHLLRFHNHVNKRLGKPQLQEDDAWTLYNYNKGNKDVCPAGVNCSLHSSSVVAKQVTPRARLASTSPPPGAATTEEVNPFAVAAGTTGVVLGGVLLAAFLIK